MIYAIMLQIVKIYSKKIQKLPAFVVVVIVYIRQKIYLFLYNATNPQQDGDILERDELCLACHNDESVAKDTAIKDFTHPYQDLILRSKVLPVLDKHEKISDFGRIACITCHNPHKWQPREQQDKEEQGNILNSFLRQKGIKDTFCVDCHGLEARLKYKYYHDENSRPQLNLEIR